MNGTVKFFNEQKQFGFIAGEDGTEYFVHVTGLAEGARIREGDNVTFDVEQGDRGPKAVRVALAGAK
ncbi:MAG: DNA-binding protein [Nanoarchaeota archaeon]|nr:DNA-binding protein [Nanoarchaeota archaeon]|tara:strand:+ start:1530 stop:1730 length:201 start_codon:yes stop_codon:yes gene_type:complete